LEKDREKLRDAVENEGGGGVIICAGSGRAGQRFGTGRRMIKTEDKRLTNEQSRTDTPARRMRDQGRIGQKLKNERPENART
jgi:hypothetical protein